MTLMERSPEALRSRWPLLRVPGHLLTVCAAWPVILPVNTLMWMADARSHPLLRAGTPTLVQAPAAEASPSRAEVHSFGDRERWLAGHRSFVHGEASSEAPPLRHHVRVLLCCHMRSARGGDLLRDVRVPVFTSSRGARLPGGSIPPDAAYDDASLRAAAATYVASQLQLDTRQFHLARLAAVTFRRKISDTGASDRLEQDVVVIFVCVPILTSTAPDATVFTLHACALEDGTPLSLRMASLAELARAGEAPTCTDVGFEAALAACLCEDMLLRDAAHVLVDALSRLRSAEPHAGGKRGRDEASPSSASPFTGVSPAVLALRDCAILTLALDMLLPLHSPPSAPPVVDEASLRDFLPRAGVALTTDELRDLMLGTPSSMRTWDRDRRSDALLLNQLRHAHDASSLPRRRQRRQRGQHPAGANDARGGADDASVSSGGGSDVFVDDDDGTRRRS